MNKIHYLFFSMIIGLSGYVWGAEQLSREQECLKEALLGSWGVYIFLQQGVQVVPLLDEDLQKVLLQYKAEANALTKKGVKLPASHTQEIREFREQLTKECEQAKEEA
jgi:hypothetical protein